MTETLYSITYITCGSICFVLAFALLTIRNQDNLPKSISFERIKHLLAFSALLTSLGDWTMVVFLANQWDTYFLFNLFFPLAYFFQVKWMSMAVLGLIHSKVTESRFMKLFTLPVVVYLVVRISYFVYCLCTYGSFAEAMENERLLETPSRLSVYGFLGIEMILCFYLIITESKQYNHQLKEICVGQELKDSQRYKKIVQLFITFFSVAIFDAICDNKPLSMFCMLVNISLFVEAASSIINYQSTYQHSNSYCLDNPPEPAPKDQTVQEAPIANNSQTSMAIAQWEQQPSKPFLRKNLTINMVAAEMEISPRALSSYINSIYQVSFNTYLNQLRIQEAKRILKENPTLPLSVVAEQSGFVNQGNFGKIFKSIEGVTLTQYRKGI